MIHTFLLEAADTGSVISRLKKIARRNQRKIRVMHMHQELLILLRHIEVSVDKHPLALKGRALNHSQRSDDADILSSLNAALDHPQQ